MKVKYKTEPNEHCTSLEFNYLELHIRPGRARLIPLRLLVEVIPTVYGCLDFSIEKIKIVEPTSKYWGNFKKALGNFKYLKKFS
jgi:hypothetical protein